MTTFPRRVRSASGKLGRAIAERMNWQGSLQWRVEWDDGRVEWEFRSNLVDYGEISTRVEDFYAE